MEINNRDYWIKVLGMLLQNWALVEVTKTGARVFFLDDLGNIFDELEFESKEEAIYGLERNGFERFIESDEEFIASPREPFSYMDGHKVYSTGEYWV